MNTDDKARLRDLLANNNTLPAYIRTAVSFAGLGFAVAKFGLNPRTMHTSAYIGTFIVLVGLLVTIIGFAQHRAVLRQVEPPAPGAPVPSRLPMLRRPTAPSWFARSWPYTSQPTLPKRTGSAALQARGNGEMRRNSREPARR